jgi:RNA polymerase sigma-70 factor, ECF subfamily
VSSSAARFLSLPLVKKTIEYPNVVAPTFEQLEKTADEVLMARIQAGDREALSVLFRRYARPVRNVGQRILRDNAEAEDLVQEVFLYIHRKSRIFDSSKSSARSWIVQVAYTQAFLRRRYLLSRRFYSSVNTDKSGTNGFATDWVANYDQTVEGLFGRNGWQKILDQLTVDQQETLRLHFFEDYTFAEISEKLGQSRVNVRHHYYRGLDKIRKHLSETEMQKR